MRKIADQRAAFDAWFNDPARKTYVHNECSAYSGWLAAKAEAVPQPVAASADTPQVIVDEMGLPPLPEMAIVADLAHVMQTPDGWDADYRSTWQKLQVEAHNKRLWRKYAMELRAALVATPVAYDCWACRKPVTMDERSNTDGDCPHCGSELDLEDWPLAAAPVQPVAVLDDFGVIEKLINVARCAYHAMDDTEENENGLMWSRDSFDALSGSVDALDRLPDDRPGYTMGPAAKAEWALRNSFAASQADVKAAS